MAFVLGVSMLLSYPEDIWWIGLMLVASSVVVIFIAVRIYYIAQKENKLFNQQLGSLNNGTSTKEIDNLKVQILVSWVYSTTEWNEFLKWKNKT